MTLFEFMVPVVAMVVVGIGTLILHIAARRMDARAKDEHSAE